MVEQVGGDHYNAKNNYQHWDWAIDIRLGYLESAATKYITRWKGKNGIQDVEKGISYLEKALEAYNRGKLKNNSTLIGANASLSRMAGAHTSDFIEYNDLSRLEANFMWKVASWQYSGDLKAAIVIAKDILKRTTEHQALQGGATPSKVGKVTLTARPTVASGGAGGTTALQPTRNASTEVASKGVEGQEHPFGYDEWSEGDIE